MNTPAYYHYLKLMLILLLSAPVAVQADEKPQDAPLVAQRMVQLAKKTLSEDAADPVRGRIALHLLEQASDLAPDDGELARLQLELMTITGQTQHRKQTLMRYLRTRPNDDVAQLQLVELLVGEAQTAEQRIAAYMKFLTGEQARQLSPPLRSHIAWRAALVCRDQGDSERFRDLLKQALELDASNPAAAAAPYELFATSPSVSEVQRMQALLVWHAAEPDHPAIQYWIVRHLLDCGQYKLALSWHDAATELSQYHPPLPADQLLSTYTDRALALWGAGRDSEAIAMIEGLSRNLSESDAEDDALTQMPVGLQSILIAIHQDNGRSDRAAAAFDHLQETLSQRNEADADSSAALVADRVWASLLFDQSIQQAEALLKQRSEAADPADPQTVRLQGWLLLRQGRTAEARELLASQAKTDLASAFGGALAAETDAERIEQLREIHRRSPGSLIGLIAARRLERLQSPPVPSPECQTMARLLRSVPAEIRRITLNAPRMTAPRILPRQFKLTYAEPIAMDITLGNISDLPLSLGLDGVLPATAMIFPSIEIDGRWHELTPQVVDLGRRLRLNAGESVTVPVHLNNPDLIDHLDNHPGATLKIRSQVMFDPQLADGGGYVPGLFGKVIGAKTIIIPAPPATDEQIDEQIQSLDASDASEALLAAAWLARTAGTLGDDRDNAAARVSTALSKAFEGMPPAHQAWLVSYLPDTPAMHNRLSRLVTRAVQSDQLLVQQALLLTLASRADAPILTAAMRQDDPAIRRFAEDVRHILKDTTTDSDSDESRTTTR